MKINSSIEMLRSRVTRLWNSATIVHRITDESTIKLFLEVLYDWFVYGCSDEDFLTMEFYRKNRREKRRWLTSAKNNRYLLKHAYDERARDIFNHKELFDKEFRSLMKHKVLILQESTWSEIETFLNLYKEVIIKPADGACGRGIFVLSSLNHIGIEDLKRRYESGENLIMEERIIQHPEMARMNPTSVNTIRIITMVDQQGGVSIINTLAKFGGSAGCVSNTWGGGVCCHINSSTGVLDRPGKDLHGGSHFRHPVTDVIIPGYQIPNWEGVCDFAKKLAQVVPSGRYIGWDIVILNDGYDVIEGNIHPGQDFQGCDGIGRWKQIRELL